MRSVCAAALALLLVAAAFLVPLTGFSDADDPGVAGKMVRTNARLSSSIPPLKLQLVSLSGDGSEAERVFAWRTIFGVRYGTTRTTERATSNSWSFGPAFITWAAFGAAEVALLGFAVRRAIAS